MHALDNTALDGNAIGGLLGEIFGTEMTTAAATCAACGTVSLVAETIVYLRAPGAVMRCRACTAILLVVTPHGEMKCVDLLGLSALEPG
ncbi:MAG TPA: DUF6510 family protein [Streptosporangiaceae bacterium]|jgi:hypothetical protein|nr:DUF6510 family protein [Streptosporangiaceae bacterium]